MNQPAIHIPTYHSRLIGRIDETTAVCDLLRDPAVRLVTILGDSGAGKTRLALEAATLSAAEFADGVFFVGLAPVTDAYFVLPTLAATLGIREQADTPLLATLQRELRTKRLLLILDNVEQVRAASAELDLLLRETQCLKLLVTSQVPLNVPPEHVFTLPPLLVPTTNAMSVEQALTFPAVALFNDRMQVVQKRFVLTPENLTAVLDICRCLQGFPLAIELVAAHSSALTPQDLLVCLRHHLAMSSFRKRNNLSSRDEILDPILTWCYSQLAEPMQLIFRRAGVFQGGCTVETLHALCVEAGLTAADVCEALQHLTEKQLIQQEFMPGNTTRYIMLDAVRAYTLALLKRRYEWRQVAEAHAAYYQQYVAAAALEFNTTSQTTWLGRLDSEIHNLRAALAWFQSCQNRPALARLVCELERYWTMRGLNNEVTVWASTLLEQPTALEPALLARCYTLLGSTLMRKGDFVQANALLHSSLQLYTDLGACLEQARTLVHLGGAAIHQGQFRAGLGFLDQALALQCLPMLIRLCC